MNNDLISREALKKNKVYSAERHEYVVPVYNIDNAPTVAKISTNNIYENLEGKEILFDDGIIWTFSEDGSCKRLILDCEYDKPISLDELREKYNAYIVISESWLSGNVYRYGNHGEFWEKIGQTIGFA